MMWGSPPRLVAYIKLVYGATRLTLGDGWFTQGRGVLQGDPLSPLLFNIIVDYVLKWIVTWEWIMEEKRWERLHMRTTWSSLLPRESV